MAKKIENHINIKNKKAYFEYEILDKYTAGIQLFGTEIKSIRQGKASLSDSYCQFFNGELFVRNLHISEYEMGTHNNHIPKRDRKLLLNKKELEKIERKTKESGFTIATLRLFLNENGLAKLEIAIAKGKKLYDKRETLKQKDSNRQINRAMKF